MKQLQKLPFFALLMILLASLAACHDDDEDEEENSGSVIGDVEYDFVMLDNLGNSADVFFQGNTITFKYTITNDSNQDANFVFPAGLPLEIQVFEKVSGSCSTLVWTYSNEFSSVTLPPSELYLEPSDVQEYSIDWDQQNDNGNLVSTGSYCVDIQVEGVSGGEGLESDEFDIN